MDIQSFLCIKIHATGKLSFTNGSIISLRSILPVLFVKIMEDN